MRLRSNGPLDAARLIGDRALRSAGLWASLFILTVPAMALYYMALGGGAFRDSSLPLESGFRADLQRLDAGLTGAIDARLAAHHDAWTEGTARFSFSALPEVSTVVSVPSAQRQLAIRVAGLWRGRHAIGNFAQWFDVSLLDEVHVTENGQESAVYRLEPTGAYGVGGSTPSPADVPDEVLFPHVAGFEGPVLRVPTSVAGELVDVSRGYEGDPAAASDDLWRMAYFSATTITTLGLGDIQPISGTARAAVTVEAGLGLLFAGLFLQALARWFADERPKRDTE